MMRDRYGLPIGASSAAARDAYGRGLDRLLAGDAGADAAFAAAIEAEPDFALAHLALARAKQALGRPAEAARPLAAAREGADRVSAREASAIDALGLLIEGKAAAAYPKIRAHVAAHPRDALVAQTCAGVFGLIGFSGQPGREAEQLAYMAALAPHYGEDWWFLCQFAFAQMEVGQLDPARRSIERAVAQKPDAPHVAHVKAHLHYECGETAEGLAYLSAFQAGLDRAAQLHCHIAWHVGLWALETGDLDQMWGLIDDAMALEGSQSPPLNVLTDAAALLARAEMRGVPVPQERWARVSAYAAARFPEPGLAFADVHAALAHAMAGKADALQRIMRDATGPAAPVVGALAEGFAAYARADWAGAVARFAGVMAEHERIGGSRAQRDLVEHAMACALLRLGRSEEAARFLRMRRPHTALSGAVADLEI